MKRFSTWLVSSKEKYSALRKELDPKLRSAAHNYYTGTVPDPKNPGQQIPLYKARGNTRLAAESLVKDLGNLLQEALVAYFSEVVKLTYGQLRSGAARKALSIEWDLLLHMPGKAKLANLEVFIASIDEFAKNYSMKKGQITEWEEKLLKTPDESEDGFIPEIGCGYTDAYSKGPEAPWLGDPGTVVLEDLSRERFEKGSPGAAWVGVLLNGKRAGLDKSIVYLVPAMHMEKHLSLPHNEAIGAKPVAQWGAAGHHMAATRLITEKRIPIDDWHRTEYTPKGKLEDVKDASWVGVMMGFAIVKAYNAIGHQWAFISGTLNKPGTDNWTAKEEGGLLYPENKGDGFLMPKRWAVAVWKATKDLEDNVYVSPGRLYRHWVQPLAAPPPPPPADAPSIAEWRKQRKYRV